MLPAGGRFLTRGLRKVSGEGCAQRARAYNIIRTINLVGAATLRASLARAVKKEAPQTGASYFSHGLIAAALPKFNQAF